MWLHNHGSVAKSNPKQPLLLRKPFRKKAPGAGQSVLGKKQVGKKQVHVQ